MTSELISALSKKSWPQTVVLIGTVAISTFWLTLSFANEIHRVERNLDARFMKIDQRFQANQEENNKRFSQVQNQLDWTWTVKMEDLKNTMLASRYPTNWVPNSFQIWDAVSHGQGVKDTPMKVQ